MNVDNPIKHPLRGSLTRILPTYVMLATPTFAEEYTFHSRDHSSIFPGSLEQDLVALRYAETDASTFPRKSIEITTKHLILCSSISNMWQKTLKTPNKLGGPVVKEGFGWGK